MPRAHSARRPTETAPARRPAPTRPAAIGSAWSARERRTASRGLPALGAAGRSSTSPAGWVSCTSWRATNASSCSASHGSSGTARVPSRPGSCSKAVPISGSQTTSSRSCSPSTPRNHTSRAGGGTSTGLDDRQAALGGDVQPRRVLLADRLPDRGGQRHQQAAVGARPPPRASASGTGPASVSSTNQPRPSWRTVRTWPIQRCLSPTAIRRASSSVVSSG